MVQPLRVYKTYKRLGRYRQVVFVLAKYGFDDIVERIGPDIISRRLFKRRGKKRAEQPTAERIRLALTELGPSFVKFGQLLSTRPDIIPDDYIRELEKLQDKVDPFPIGEVKRIFVAELGTEPESLFTRFEEQPIASGSIAQVHHATLPDGTRVAVKVQRPNIRSVIETDLEILHELAGVFERHIPEARWYRPAALVDQFSSTIRRELDFVAEGHAAERFRINFENIDTFFIPSVYWDYTTEKILTIDFIDGVKITNVAEIEKRGYDKKAIARNGARAILKEVFEDRFFHGDPHPGNFFVLKNGVIAAVDFGIVGRLDEETTDQLSALLHAVVNRDVDKVLFVFKMLNMLEDTNDTALLKYDVMEFVDRYYGLPLDKLDAQKVVNDLLNVFRRHRLILPVNLATVGRMLLVSAGVGRMLDPKFDMVAEAKPFIESFIYRRFDPRRQVREIMNLFDRFRMTLRMLPSDLEEIVQKLKKGKMLVQLHHEGLNKFILEMDRSSNRLTFGMIIAALIVGSSLVMQLERGPMLFGFSIFGILGYLIAGILGLWLAIAILRSGKI
jgi:ubiquinone biosynthesis protein